MAGAALPGGLTPPEGISPPGPWQPATVVGIHPETPTAKTFRLELEHPSPHLAGQHYVVRLTAPDGYQASRSYSVASPPGEGRAIELTVERLPDGEVSTFLHDQVRLGDELEVRGPIGGWFVWRGDRPAWLIGGGAGMVPLMAMLRLARRAPDQHLASLVVSVRAPGELYYADELEGPDVNVAYTRQAPPGRGRPPGRITAGDLPGRLPPGGLAYICGSSPFVDAATALVLGAGARPQDMRAERFGPTG